MTIPFFSGHHHTDVVEPARPMAEVDMVDAIDRHRTDVETQSARLYLSVIA
jgi:hypothetical protein